MIYNSKTSLAERNKIINNINIFSEIEISLSRLCNKKCIYCPHSNNDYAEYNKSKQPFINYQLIERITEQLIDINFSELIVLSGFGEPTIHPEYEQIIKLLSTIGCNIRLITNGHSIKTNNHLLSDELLNNKKLEVIISVYDESDMEIFSSYTDAKLKKVFLESGVPTEIAQQFNFNNRCGDSSANAITSLYTKCYYPFFMLIIDTDGNVQYCPHNWRSVDVLGNINDDKIIDIWKKDTHIRKMMLENSRQSIPLCSKCSVNGTLIGKNAYNNARLAYKDK